jgi:DNA-binding transcriptional LysR family regulator
VRVLCASPDYIHRRGLLRDARELPEHDGLDWDALSPPHAWRFEVDGRAQLLRPGRLRMTANNAETLLFGAVAGLGIAHLPTWLISDYLLRGELLPLLCENGLPPAEPSGIYALRLASDASTRTRLLLDFLRQRFGPVPPWDLALQRGLQAGT